MTSVPHCRGHAWHECSICPRAGCPRRERKDSLAAAGWGPAAGRQNPAGTTALETTAATMFNALGCAGVARIDFFLTTDGPLLNEVNTMPGFTEHSQVPRMLAAAGMPYPRTPRPSRQRRA